MLIIRLLSFGLGGVVAVLVRARFQQSYTVAVVAGAITYVAIDLLVERILFG